MALNKIKDLGPEFKDMEPKIKDLGPILEEDLGSRDLILKDLAETDLCADCTGQRTGTRPTAGGPAQKDLLRNPFQGPAKDGNV